MALAFRRYKGVGTRVDWGEAALHYKHAAQLAVRTLTPRGGGGAGEGALRTVTRAARVRLVDYGEEASLAEELLADARVVAAVQACPKI